MNERTNKRTTKWIKKERMDGGKNTLARSIARSLRKAKREVCVFFSSKNKQNKKKKEIEFHPPLLPLPLPLNKQLSFLFCFFFWFVAHSFPFLCVLFFPRFAFFYKFFILFQCALLWLAHFQMEQRIVFRFDQITKISLTQLPLSQCVLHAHLLIRCCFLFFQTNRIFHFPYEWCW